MAAQHRWFDVCVFGAGPAGVATGIRLAAAGASVVILDRPMSDPPWVGETFSNAICAPLAELGLWDRFVEAGHGRGYEIRSVWGGPQMVGQNALFDPQGARWHVDRGRFDRDLREEAVARGCALRLYARLGAVRRENGCWTIALGERRSSIARALSRRCDGAAVRARAPARRAAPAFRPARRARGARRAQRRCRLRARDRRRSAAQRLVVRLARAARPRARVSHRSRSRAGRLRRARRAADRRRRQHADRARPAHALARGRRRVRRVRSAVRLGRHARAAQRDSRGRCDSRVFEHDTPSSLEAYHAARRAEFDEYLDGLVRHYSREERWAAAPFWTRRSHALAATA